MSIRVSTTVTSFLCLSLLVGCSHSAPPPIAPAAGPPTTEAQATPSAPHARPSDTSGTISISDEIRKACGISDEDAYFAFDSARIDSRATNVLSQVAKCFETGPLAGKKLNLVGRADPRGESEYNMVLGGQRASAVSGELQKLGLSQSKISWTSRGEMDAKGTDEASWALDRRVDVLLGSR